MLDRGFASALTRHDDQGWRERAVLSGLGEGLSGGASASASHCLGCDGTHQIPAVFLDPLQSVFGDDTPDEARHVDGRAEFEVELDGVFCLVDELNEVPAEADGHLREVVARHEREGGVQGLDIPPPGGEVEEVGVPVRDEPVERWFGELGLE